jgi:hypothetical protein
MHLGDHPPEPHRLGEECRILLVDHGPALRGIRVADRLGVGVEITQGRQRERPALGAVVKETLHEHQWRRRVHHCASEHRREVFEARSLEGVGHLELLRRSRLDAAQMFQKDGVTHLDRGVALLDSQVAHRG